MFSIIIKYKSKVKNLGFYFFASFVPMLVSLVMSPLLALFLSPSDYAIVGYYNSFNTLFFPLILFYLNQYYMREFFYCDENGKKKLFALIFKTFLWLPFVVAGIVVGLFGLYMFFFNSTSEIPYLPYAILSFFTIAFSSLFYLEQVLLRNNRNGKAFFGLCLFNSLAGALASLAFVVIFDMGALGRMLGLSIAPICLFIWLIYKHREVLKTPYIIFDLKKAVLFCWPLVIAAMLGFFTNGIDRVILEKYVPMSQLGFYSIGITIAGYLSVFSTAIGNTFSPDVLESLAKKNFRKMLKYVALQIGVILFVVFVFVLLAKYLIIIFTANRYLEATPYARIAAFAAVTTICYSTVSNVIFSYKKTKILLYTKIIGSVLCVVMYVFLIKNYSMQGAAIAHSAGNLVLAVVALLLLLISLYKDKRIK